MRRSWAFVLPLLLSCGAEPKRAPSGAAPRTPAAELTAGQPAVDCRRFADGAASIPARIARGDLPIPETSAAWVTTHFSPNAHPSVTGIHVLASDTVLLVGDGVHPMVSLDPITGKQRWTAPFAGLPVVVSGGRVLTTTSAEPVWLTLATGAREDRAQSPTTCAIAWSCPDAASVPPGKSCMVAVASYSAGERTFVAHGGESCHYESYGPVAAPRWVCDGSAELLELRGENLVRVEEPTKELPLAPTGPVCQNPTCTNTAAFEGARIEPQGQSPVVLLHTAADGKSRTIRAPKDAVYRSNRSVDGRYIAFSRPGRIWKSPAGNGSAQLTDFSIVDVVSGKVTALAGSMADADLHFLIAGRTVLVSRTSTESYTTVIPELAAFDAETGAERWRRTFPLPAAPTPPPAASVDPLTPPAQ